MFGKAVVGILMVTLLSFPIARTASADVDGWEAAGLVLAGAVGYARRYGCPVTMTKSGYLPSHGVCGSAAEEAMGTGKMK